MSPEPKSSRTQSAEKGLVYYEKLTFLLQILHVRLAIYAKDLSSELSPTKKESLIPVADYL